MSWAIWPEGLQQVFDPAWSARDDIQLMTLRDRGVSLHRIAQGLGHEPEAVQARWHCLRVVPNVGALLHQVTSPARVYPKKNAARQASDLRGAQS